MSRVSFSKYLTTLPTFQLPSHSFGNRCQEFLRAIIHLKPTALSLDTIGSTTDPIDTVSPSAAHPNISSPRGYFDGMPGRRLGGDGGNLERRSRRSSSEEDPRSAPPAYPETHRENSPSNRAAAAARDRREASPPVVGPATAAALRFESDAREERRAWARRAGVGRTARVATTAIGTKRNTSPSPGLNPQRIGRGRSRTSSFSPSKRSRDGVLDRASTERSRSTQRPRVRRTYAGDDEHPTAIQTSPASSVAKPNEEPVLDVVSLAFERYAKDRERDRDGSSRVGPRSPQRTAPATHLGFSVQPDESEESPTEGNIGGYPSSDRRRGRQRQRSQDAHQPGTRPSKVDRDVPLKNERVRQATGVNSGDEGGGRSRRASFTPRVSDEWKKWTNGEDTAGLGERRRDGGIYGGDDDGVGRESADDDDGAGISGKEKEGALRRAFDMYDLNGDGFITYLEVGDDSETKIVEVSGIFMPFPNHSQARDGHRNHFVFRY